jgi:hypothetical protein
MSVREQRMVVSSGGMVVTGVKAWGGGYRKEGEREC